MAKKMTKLWLIPLILLFPIAVRANQITPQFTQGSMQATTTTTQVVTEVIDQEVFGGTYNSWSGTNITPSGAVGASGTTYSVHTAGDDFQLEIVERSAGVIETEDITRTVEQTSVTTSLSVFSQ